MSLDYASTAAAATKAGREVEIIHKENAIGSFAMYFMFLVNVAGVVCLVAVVGSIIQTGGGSRNAAAAILASSSLLMLLFTIWAGMAVVCGAVRYFNRRTFIRVPGKE